MSDNETIKLLEKLRDEMYEIVEMGANNFDFSSGMMEAGKMLNDKIKQLQGPC